MDFTKRELRNQNRPMLRRLQRQIDVAQESQPVYNDEEDSVFDGLLSKSSSSKNSFLRGDAKVNVQLPTFSTPKTVVKTKLGILASRKNGINY